MKRGKERSTRVIPLVRRDEGVGHDADDVASYIGRPVERAARRRAIDPGHGLSAGARLAAVERDELGDRSSHRSVTHFHDSKEKTGVSRRV